MKTKLPSMLIGLLIISGGTYAQVDAGATTSTKNLYYNLKEIAWDTTGVLFGQEFYNSFSFVGGNHEDESRSDFKDVTGDHPAVLGQDFQFYIDPTKSADEKRKHKEAAKYVYNNGGVVTFDYHMQSKYHSSHTFLPGSSDQYLMYNIGENNNTYGEVTWFKGELDKMINVMNNDLKFPVVFRLFHEMNGDWMWWGTKATGGSASYIKMYKLAINYIKSKTNYALFAWAPNYPFTGGANPGINYYPGDTYVDVVGLDMYDMNTANGQPFSVMADQLTALSDFAWNHNKIPVLSEAGNRVNGPDQYNYWWYNLDDELRSGIRRAWKIAWMLTWVNRGWDAPAYAPYVAYSGSTSAAKTALIQFKEKKNVFTLKDSKRRNMYNSSYKSSMGSAKFTSDMLQVKQESLLTVYPNPITDGTFSINLGRFSGVLVDVRLVNTDRHEVFKQLQITGKPTIKINAGELASGIYVLTIQGEDINETQKLLVK